jgi:hypothetical protein
MDKQRTEYEKYLIDIRYYNEQNKLKLLDKIEKLQGVIDQQKSLDSSFQSVKDYVGDKTTADKLINIITDVNERLTSAKLEFQEEKIMLLTSKEELEKKLALADQKIKKLSHKSREQSNRINSLSNARAQMLKSNNEKMTSRRIFKLRESSKSLNDEAKKYENIISNFKRDLKVSKSELSVEQELRRRLYKENVKLKLKIQEIIKQDQKEISELKNKKSRNKNNKLEFSDLTSYKTESNVLKSMIDGFRSDCNEISNV